MGQNGVSWARGDSALVSKGLRSGLEGAQHESRKGLLQETLAGKGSPGAGGGTSASRKRHKLPVSPPGYTGDDDYPSWTWDPTSGEDLTKGTTVAARPGHTLSWATTTNTEVPSPATQNLPDTGEGLNLGAYAKACVMRSESKWWSSIHKLLYLPGDGIRPLLFCLFCF